MSEMEEMQEEIMPVGAKLDEEAIRTAFRK